MTNVDLRRRHPQQCRPRWRSPAATCTRGVAAALHRLVEGTRARSTSRTQDVYLRTAVAVGQEGWANFDYVKMPDYRWGIFLADAEPDRRIAFGDDRGEPVWQEVPGEHRADLRRLVVVQGDTEPASVEQQRHLCLTAPSVYDLRNLFQVNVEEGRHLWAMVYLLHRVLRSRRARRGRRTARASLGRSRQPADPRRVQRTDARTGCRSSSSPTSRIATGSSSSPRSGSPRSTRCPGRATSC